MDEISGMRRFDENENLPRLVSNGNSFISSDSQLNNPVNHQGAVKEAETTNCSFSKTVCSYGVEDTELDALNVNVTSGAETSTQGRTILSGDSSGCSLLSETICAEIESTVPQEFSMLDEGIKIDRRIKDSNRSLNNPAEHCVSEDQTVFNSTRNSCIDIERNSSFKGLSNLSENPSSDMFLSLAESETPSCDLFVSLAESENASSDMFVSLTDTDSSIRELPVKSHLCVVNPPFAMSEVLRDSDSYRKDNNMADVSCELPKPIDDIEGNENIADMPCRLLKTVNDNLDGNGNTDDMSCQVPKLVSDNLEGNGNIGYISCQVSNSVDDNLGDNQGADISCDVPKIISDNLHIKPIVPNEGNIETYPFQASSDSPKSSPSKVPSDNIKHSSLSAPSLHDICKNSSFKALNMSGASDNSLDIPVSPNRNETCSLFKLPNNCANNVPSEMVTVQADDVSDSIFETPNPNPLNDEFVDAEEEFTDATQFFKDPSSFKFFETAASSVSSIPRSSLYVTFDPLYSNLASQHRKISDHLQLISDANNREMLDAGSNVKPNNKLIDISTRESLGNMLLSFDSPKKSRPPENCLDVSLLPADNPKLYTEEEFRQAVEIYGLTLEGISLKKQKELEQELIKIRDEGESKSVPLSNLCKSQHEVINELMSVAADILYTKDELQYKLKELETENVKLKNDLKIAGEDLQSVESTFADFHKRYEQCKGMLKVYKDNEDKLKQNVENLKLQCIDEEQKYTMLEQRTHEILDKANDEVASSKKTNEAQVAVLKAQLKKAELKISGLESDLKQIKMENNQLGGICDDLMAKVNET